MGGLETPVAISITVKQANEQGAEMRPTWIAEQFSFARFLILLKSEGQGEPELASRD